MLKCRVLQPSSSTQNASVMIEKGKMMMNVGEQNLGMVPVIIDRPEKTIADEVKER